MTLAYVGKRTRTYEALMPIDDAKAFVDALDNHTTFFGCGAELGWFKFEACALLTLHDGNNLSIKLEYCDTQSLARMFKAVLNE